MRTKCLRAAVVRDESGCGGFVAKPEMLTLTAKLLSILAAVVFLSGLTGCNPLKGLSFGSSCTVNCQSPPPPPESLYATGINQILAFTIDPSSGALSAPQVTTGPNNSGGIVASMNGQLYVSDFLNDEVDGFSINSSSGALTAITNSPFSLGDTPPGAGGLTAFVQGGTYLYATDLNAGKVAGFLYDSTSGMLTPVPGSPFPAGNTPAQAVQVAPQASGPLFLYVSNVNDSVGGISAYAINQQNGSLTQILGSPFPTGAPGSYPGPSAMVVSADNNFLYVALAGSANANNQIVAFSINPTTGSLTALPQSPFTTGNDPLEMAYVPITEGSDGFLYTANIQDDTISAFTVDNTTGVLTPIKGSPYAAGTSVMGLSQISTSSGKYFLYAADFQAQTVIAYTIDGSTGALTPLQGSPFAAGGAPSLLTTTTP